MVAEVSGPQLSEAMVTQGDGVLEGDALTCGVDQVLIAELAQAPHHGLAAADHKLSQVVLGQRGRCTDG